MRLKLVTPPVAEPLTTGEAKERLDLTDSMGDLALEAWIIAERQRLDGANGALGRCLITQTWDLILDWFPGCGWGRPIEKGFYPRLSENLPWWYYEQGIAIPLPPTQSIVSVKYLDTDGAEQTVDPAQYRLVSGEPALLVPKVAYSWPAADAEHGSVTVRFTAGYGDSGNDVPEPIRLAMVMGISLSRSFSGQSLLIRSETVDGVGSTDYSGGAQAVAAVRDQVAGLLGPYRVGGGIS